MRRYNSLNSSKEGEGIDITDSVSSEPKESTPFSEIEFEDTKKYTKTLILVFTLFFVGLVCIKPLQVSISFSNCFIQCTLITSTLILLGHLDNEVYADRLIPLMVRFIFITSFYTS